MFRKLVNKLKTICLNFNAYTRRYVWPLPKFRKEVVVMIDGDFQHGGLTDRFRNILSVYSYCKSHGIRFRLYYVYPIPLQQLLKPNKYNWLIRKKDISYSYYDSEELNLWVKLYKKKCFNDDNIRLNNLQHLAILDAIWHSNKRKQYHIYGNCYFAKGNFRELFQELFTPTPYLKAMLSQHAFSFQYEAVTLRFQQLLGDFKEGDFEILSDKNREELINQCIGKIKELYDNDYFSTSQILVTSDSQTFLSYVEQLPYVHIIPGEMEHMDYTQNKALNMNAKSFIDLFMLAKAQRVTLLQTGKMYKSGFPEFAAELGNVSYNRICF